MKGTVHEVKDEPTTASAVSGQSDDVGADAATLAAEIRAGVRRHADPAYVPGTVAARSPGKPVLGVRIPLLRAAVHAAARAVSPRRGGADAGMVRAAATVLWHGTAHEDELAACMLLRRTAVAPTAAMVHDWAPLLDNWLSVDEFGAVLGAALQADALLVEDLDWLAVSASDWQRRLFLVMLITPMCAGLDPVAVPGLAGVLPDPAKPVRKAAVWLVSAVLKRRPDAAAQFQRVLGAAGPRPLLRLVDR